MNPGPAPTAWTLPSIPLPGWATKAQGEFRCKASLRNPISTHVNSKSKPATSVEAAVEDPKEPLAIIWISKYLVLRLSAYVEQKLQEQLRHLQTPAVHALDCPGVSTTVPEATFYTALSTIKTMEEYIRLRTPHPLINIMSIQDELQTQVIDLVNEFIKTRYANTAANVGANKTYSDTEGVPVSNKDASEILFYPAWTRVCPDHLKPNPENYKAGFSDFGLFRSPNGQPEERVAAVEGKTPWAYPTFELEAIFAGSHAIFDPVTDWFRSDDKAVHAGNVLLRQVWGELRFFGSEIGFATNLDVVFFFVKVPREGKEDTKGSKGKRPKRGDEEEEETIKSGLVLSPLMSWTDPGVHQAIMGLTFVALDAPHWKQSGKNLRDLMCPPDECTQIRASPTAPGGGQPAADDDGHYEERGPAEDEGDDDKGDDNGQEDVDESKYEEVRKSTKGRKSARFVV